MGCTIVYVGIDDAFAGFLALSDTLRAKSQEMIQEIKDTGIRPLLLTGDHENAAYAIAGQRGIDDCYAGCLPEDKLNWMDTYQRRNEPVCMIGDGVNDAPALKKAMVGIVGSDIIVDATDIALVDDEAKKLPHLLRLSKRMMRTIRCNLTFSMTLNFCL